MPTRMRKRIMVLDTDEERGQQIVNMIGAEEHLGYLMLDTNRALAQIYNDTPDLIVMAVEDERWKPFLRMLKTDTVFAHIAVLGILAPAQLRPGASFENLPLDDFTFLPVDLSELLLRIHLAIDKASRTLDANPLSRLPGNYSIVQAVQRHIEDEKPFAFAHLDIDNFKPFNDRYGFTRGDEVIRMSARVLVNTVRIFPEAQSFVGHIGGDDFVLIVNPAHLDAVCQQIITNFEMLASMFYDDEDRARGFIESVDRQGTPRRFPLLSISIAAVLSTNHDFTHYGQYSTAANEVKKKVKQMEGSNYLVDRRCSKDEEEEKGIVN